MRGKTCIVDGCDNPKKTRGMCNKHYLRWWNDTPAEERKPRDPSLTTRYEPLADRLMRQVAVQPNGCWHWTSWINEHGYGQVKLNGKSVAAHRAMYIALIGPVPEDRELDHLCHTRDASCPGGDTCLHRRCVNPACLEPVTTRVNALRSRSATAKNATKTHCSQGHPFDEQNTIVSKRQRTCRECARIARRKWYDANRRVEPKPPATHCKHGHEWTPENTYVAPSGLRACRKCTAESQRRYKERKRQQRPTA